MEEGLMLATAGDDIKLWDVAASSTPLHQFFPHASGVSSISWSHNNQILASAGSAGDKVILTFIKNATSNIIEIAEEEKQTCVSFNSTSRYLLTGGKNRIVSIWDLKSRKLKKTYTGHQASVTNTTFNWNDTYIASGSTSGEILLHNVVSGQASTPLTAPKVQSIRGLEFSHFKKSLLASVSDDGGLTMWDTNTRKAVSTFKDAHRAPATALGFSPVNDMLLMSTGLDKRIVCYDVLGKSIIKSMNVESPLTSISCHQDGATLAVGSTRGKIYIFDLRMGSTPLKVLHGHKSAVQCVQFQHGPSTKSNGVGSKGAKTAQSTPSGRKPPQVTPGVGQVSSPQRGSKSSTDAASDGRPGKSQEEMRASTNRLTPREDIENQDIISPLREGSVPAIKYEDNINHISRPDTVGKADGTPVQSRDSLPDFFSPLSENASNISRRSPIGLLELEPQSPLNSSQPMNKGSPSESHPPASAEVTASDPVSSSRSNPTGSHQSRSKPDLSPQLNRVTSPTREPSKPSSAPWTLPLGVATPPSATDPVPRTGNERVRPASTTKPIAAVPSTNGTAATTTVPIGSMVEVDAKPFSSPSWRSASPARGLLGGSSSSDSAPRVVNVDGEPLWARTAYRGDGELGAAPPGAGELQPFQTQFIKNMIEDSLEDFKESFHKEVLHLQREMVRQFQIQQNQMQEMLQKYSVNEGLLTELERLREENKRLKAKF